MALKKKYKNWHGEKDADGIFWLYVDKTKSSANVLSKELLSELGEVIKEVASIKPLALVIGSAKEKGFIAGADIKEFVSIKDEKEGFELIKRGQLIMDSIEALSFPTVAMINGFCLGGGLELALACNYRVADNDHSIKLGLPEIKLGIHPGFGGTVRACKLVGGLAAMDMMLTGRMISVKAAKKIGLVDMAVPKRHLKNAAKLMALKPPKKRKGLGWKKLADAKLFRRLVAGKMRKKVSSKARKEHYPAPFELIDLYEKYLDSPSRMYEEEAKSVASLITGDTAQNLVQVFFLQERLKSFGGKAKVKFGHLHVVGAGVMGGDIAAWSALRGMSVTLQDREPKFIAPAIKRAHKLFSKKLKEKRLVQAAIDRLMPDVDGNGIREADVIVEAIFEDLDAKRALFKDLEKKAKKSAILATNTSSIPIEEIAEALKKPERLVGIHFFNPVAQMMLVEVVKGKNSSDKMFNSSVSYVQQIGKLPLPVKSTPGFLVNRILVPYLLEGVEMVTEGIAPERIDEAAVKFGMPMGPVLLADTVGLDICLHVAEIFSKYMDMKIPEKLEKMVKAGELGKKSGKGFYQYENGKQIKNKDAVGGNLKEIEDRLLLRYLNESVASLRESVVEDSDLLDAGMIFGTGFAPFRGGPMRYIKSVGVGFFEDKFKELEEKYGSRFKMDDGWKTIGS